MSIPLHSQLSIVRPCVICCPSQKRSAWPIHWNEPSYVPVACIPGHTYRVHRTWLDHQAHLQCEMLIDGVKCTATAYFDPIDCVVNFLRLNGEGDVAYIFEDEGEFDDWTVRSAL